MEKGEPLQCLSRDSYFCDDKHEENSLRFGLHFSLVRVYGMSSIVLFVEDRFARVPRGEETEQQLLSKRRGDKRRSLPTGDWTLQGRRNWSWIDLQPIYPEWNAYSCAFDCRRLRKRSLMLKALLSREVSLPPSLPLSLSLSLSLSREFC